MCKSSKLCRVKAEAGEQQLSDDAWRRRKASSRLTDVGEAGVECRAFRKTGIISGANHALESRCLMPLSAVAEATGWLREHQIAV